jgi:hypothetical protein
MDEREQQRKIRHRLAVLCHTEEVSENVAATCRYSGISWPTFYKWLHQYEEFGEEGLRDRSNRLGRVRIRPTARWSARSCACRGHARRAGPAAGHGVVPGHGSSATGS